MNVFILMSDHKSDITSSRRTALKTISASVVGLGSTVTLTGLSSAEGEITGAADVGIEDAVLNLLKQRRFAEAKILCEQHDVTFKHSTVKMPSTEAESADGDDVSTQSEYDKSGSEFTHSAYSISGDNMWKSHCAWDLEFAEPGACVDGDGPPDAAGITFSSDKVRPVDWWFGDRTTLRKRGSEGVIGGFDDPDMSCGSSPYVPPDADLNAQMTVDYEKTESGPANIYGTYTHTWAMVGQPSWVSYSLSAGPIGVSAGGATDYWKKRNDQVI